MPLTSGKYKRCVFAFLNIGSQLGFDVLFRILANLLKLVNGYDARSVGIFEEFEYLFQRENCLVDFAYTNIKSWCIGRRLRRVLTWYIS